MVLSPGTGGPLRRGGRLAQPGEFTKRAFLNGRLDLPQAEAVADLLEAETPEGVRGGGTALRGPVPAGGGVYTVWWTCWHISTPYWTIPTRTSALWRQSRSEACSQPPPGSCGACWKPTSGGGFWSGGALRHRGPSQHRQVLS